MRFSTSAFELASANAPKLDGALLKVITPVYLEIRRYNSLADYDQARVNYGTGALDEQLKIRAAEVGRLLSEALGRLG